MHKIKIDVQFKVKHLKPIVYIFLIVIDISKILNKNSSYNTNVKKVKKMIDK